MSFNSSMNRTEPYIEITEQPKTKGFRFRYECEGRSAGSIPGERSTADNRSFPSIKIHNIEGMDCVVVVSCVTKDDAPKPHPHSLVGKDCQKGVCTVRLKKTNVATFANLGIQCAKKREVQKNLEERKAIRVDPFSTGFKFDHNNIDLSVVRLCFQAFIPDSNGKFTRIIKPVVSNAIYDKKSKSDLGICRISLQAGSVRGGDEVFLLCEKVNKDDIEIRFFEEDDHGETRWEGRGEFGIPDVHRQFAIVFRTPPYHDRNIRKPVSVQMQLKRPSDGELSDPVTFQYIPENKDPDGIELKRKRKAIHLETAGDAYLQMFDQTATGGMENHSNMMGPSGYSMVDMQQQIPSGVPINSMPGNNTMASELDNMINNLPSGVDQALNGQNMMEGAMGLDIDQSLYLSSLDSNLETLLKSSEQADSGELVRILTDANGILAGNMDFKLEQGASLHYEPMQQDPNLNRNQQWS